MNDRQMDEQMAKRLNRWTDRKNKWINGLTDAFVLKCKMDASNKKWTDFKPHLFSMDIYYEVSLKIFNVVLTL